MKKLSYDIKASSSIYIICPTISLVRLKYNLHLNNTYYYFLPNIFVFICKTCLNIHFMKMNLTYFTYNPLSLLVYLQCKVFLIDFLRNVIFEHIIYVIILFSCCAYEHSHINILICICQGATSILVLWFQKTQFANDNVPCSK
jgi:hypothetical protein